MKVFSQDLMTAINESKRDPSNYVRFTIYAYYLDAQQNEQTDGITVTITAPGYTQGAGNYIDVPLGTPVTYTVTKEDYETEGPITVAVTGPAIKRVQITNLPMWTFTVTPTPADSTITMASGNRTSNTGTIQVPQGSTVTYSISHAGMNSYSGSRLIPASPQDTNPITIARTLTSTLSMRSVTPADATIAWSTGVGDPTSGLSVTAPCTSTVALTVSKPGYTSYTRNFPSQGQYLVITDVGDVVLTPKTCVATISCNEPTALIEVWKEENGVEVPNSRQSGYLQVQYNCIIGDDLHWTATKQYYSAIPGSHTITATDADNGTYTAPPIVITVNNYPVRIYSVPAEAEITIYNGSSQIAHGYGDVTASVDAGTYVTYEATLGGVTETGNVTVTGPYQDTLTLSATDGQTVNLVATSGTETLQYGRWRFVLVGGAAGGHTSYSQATSSTRTAYGSKGGGGGGSAYVLIKDIIISSRVGQQVTFAVGSGGASNVDGTASSITTGGETFTAAGGKCGYSDSVIASVYYSYGGDGGSGGGAGGQRGDNTLSTTRTLPTDGGNGAYAGQNGQDKLNYYQTNYYYNYGGIGAYNNSGVYENNYGAKTTTLTNGYPGGGGRGLISIQNDLTNPEYFLTLVEGGEQVLYNNLGGGGGGGATGTPAINSTIPTIYGGPGGGGGAWEAGTTGVAGAPGTGGTGGNGRILYMRVAWS